MKLLSATSSNSIVTATDNWDRAVESGDADAILVAGNELARLLVLLVEWERTMSAYDYAIEAGIGPNIAVRFADWHAAYFPESDVRHAWHAWNDAFPYLTKGVK